MLILLLFSFIIISIGVLLYKSYNKRFLSILKETIVAQVVIWLIYIVLVFIDGAIGNILGDSWGIISLIILVMIAVILTKYYMKSDKEETEKTKRFILTSIIWIIENTIIGLLITEIIRGWDAIGYAIMIGWIAIAPIVLVLIGKVISYIYHKIKA